MKEYMDGILLFELTDQKVWSKAVKDSAGLRDFYNTNKDKYPDEEKLLSKLILLKMLRQKQCLINYQPRD